MFLILVSTCLLLVYRNTIDLWMFIVYPVIFQNSLLSSGRLYFFFFVDSLQCLWSFYVHNHVICRQYYFFLPGFMLLTCFSCIIVVAGTSSTTLNGVVSGHPHFVLDRGLSTKYGANRMVLLVDALWGSFFSSYFSVSFF